MKEVKPLLMNPWELVIGLSTPPLLASLIQLIDHTISDNVYTLMICSMFIYLLLNWAFFKFSLLDLLKSDVFLKSSLTDFKVRLKKSRRLNEVWKILWGALLVVMLLSSIDLKDASILASLSLFIIYWGILSYLICKGLYAKHYYTVYKQVLEERLEELDRQ